MKMRVILPAIAALVVLTAAAPSSAQGWLARYGYDMQAGGGAGPYDLRCRRLANFNQRERCTTLAQYYRPRHYWRRAY
jgi:hypothetical protein